MRMQLSRKQSKGFTLLELVVVLGISGLIFGGLWGLLTSGSSQLQAQAAAQQYRQVIDATRRLLSAGIAVDGSGSNDFDPSSYTLNTPANLGLNVLTDSQVRMLSPNFAQGSGATYYDAYGHQILVSVEKLSSTDSTKWRFMVYSTPPAGVAAISDKAGAQISALIGAEGGFIYSNATEGCSAAGTFTRMACGTFNSFALDITTPGAPTLAAFFASPSSGRVATLSFTADNSISSAPWLMRLTDSTGGGFNTMQANMDFKSGAGIKLQMKGNTLNMATDDGDTTGAGTLNLNGGILNLLGGDINMNTVGSTSCPGGKTCALSMAGGPLNMNATGSTTGGNTLNMAAGTITNLGGTTSCPTSGGWGGSCQLSGAGVRMGFTSTVMTNSTGGMDLRLAPGFSLVVRNEPQNTSTIVLDMVGQGRANTFQAGQFIYTSDMRLKHNIRPIPNALEKVLTLRGVKYDWNTNDASDVGLLAQDVEKVFPELVSHTDGNKGIDYGKMVAPLVEAIRQLKKENDALRTRLNAMEERLPAN